MVLPPVTSPIQGREPVGGDVGAQSRGAKWVNEFTGRPWRIRGRRRRVWLGVWLRPSPSEAVESRDEALDARLHENRRLDTFFFIRTRARIWDSVSQGLGGLVETKTKKGVVNRRSHGRRDVISLRIIVSCDDVDRCLMLWPPLPDCL
jgi:hypothetical protein